MFFVDKLLEPKVLYENSVVNLYFQVETEVGPIGLIFVPIKHMCKQRGDSAINLVTVKAYGGEDSISMGEFKLFIRYKKPEKIELLIDGAIYSCYTLQIELFNTKDNSFPNFLKTNRINNNSLIYNKAALSSILFLMTNTVINKENHKIRYRLEESAQNDSIVAFFSFGGLDLNIDIRHSGADVIIKVPSNKY